MTADDYPLLQALTTPQLVTGSDRRLAQEGVGPRLLAAGSSSIERALAGDGPPASSELRERLRAAGVPVAGPAMVHVLFRAALEGRIVRGPVAGSEHRYALVADWLPSAPSAVTRIAADRDRALRELALRYLAGHGPADERDLAKWAGLTLRDARAGLAALGDRRRARGGLVELAGRTRVGTPPGPRRCGSSAAPELTPASFVAAAPELTTATASLSRPRQSSRPRSFGRA